MPDAQGSARNSQGYRRKATVSVEKIALLVAALEKRALSQGSKKGRLGAAPGCSDRNARAEPPDDFTG